MDWYKTKIQFDCARCGKPVKPGRKLGLHGGKVYCYHCGHNMELATSHRFYSRQDTIVKQHMGAI